jgi:hypothetical protein
MLKQFGPMKWKYTLNGIKKKIGSMWMDGYVTKFFKIKNKIKNIFMWVKEKSMK